MNLDRFSQGLPDIQCLNQCLFCGNVVYTVGNELCQECEEGNYESED